MDPIEEIGESTPKWGFLQPFGGDRGQVSGHGNWWSSGKAGAEAIGGVVPGAAKAGWARRAGKMPGFPARSTVTAWNEVVVRVG